MDAQPQPKFCHAHPLVPAAALFLLGAACGRWCDAWGGLLVFLALISWLLWIAAERLHRHPWAHAALALALATSGGATWVLNQSHLEPSHVASLARDDEQLIALRADVLAAPSDTESRGNRFWIAHAREIWTDRGWQTATGDLMIQSPVAAVPLRRGTHIELYGWLSRPAPALNPGAFNPRTTLAADRLFAQVRVPRPGGIVLLDASEARGDSPLTAMRTFLQAKLLEHTLQQDVPAAYAMTALLLGYRDRAMADVSQSFADAGVAHLLAISGTHIVFFTALVWGVLRFLPLRPKRRELLIAAVVTLYVLATPCGPPILRAAVALLMVLAARLIGRPRQHLNILAAAAVLIVLLRPTDLFDAGCQLSFITTAGLLVFSTRVHAALFQQRLARATLIAELSASRWARWRLRAWRTLAAILTANLIGAATAIPLVAYHFGQVNFWAVLAGLIALPIVSLAMVTAALQLLAELVGLGAGLSPLTALIGRAMIWLVRLLAHLPGSVWAVRAPPVWLILAAYGILLLWALRRHLGLPRALIVNSMLALAVITAAWYAFTAPVGEVHLTAFNSGDGTCLLLRTPRGELWTIDAGSALGTSTSTTALRPALRLAGSRQIDGLIITALDVPHARQAASVMDLWRPQNVWVSQPAWDLRGQTLAGAQIAAAQTPAITVKTLHQGQTLDLGAGCTVEVLWPPHAAANLGRPDLILRLAYAGKSVLIADPAASGALALLPPRHCDAILFTGLQRGAADAPVLRAVQPFGLSHVIWCGRGPWSPQGSRPGEWNTAAGAVDVRLTPSGMTVQTAR